MDDGDSGKLELLFAYLSINNVSHIRRLLIDSIDEYQAIAKNMSYEERKDVNFIKSLLWHADRGEWIEARNLLNKAQMAYQNYLHMKVDSKKVNGYAQIHGRKLDSTQQGLLQVKPNPKSYMYKEGEFPADHQNPKYIYSPRGMFTASGPRDNKESIRPGSYNALKPDSNQSSIIYLTPEEQGPDIRVKSRFIDYPGAYSRQLQRQSATFRDDMESVNVHSRDTSKPKCNRNGQREQRDILPHELDQNKPSKIADSFTDIYHKEWKYALTSMKILVSQEEKRVACLLYILMEAYKFCMDEAQIQVLEFETAALNIITNGKYTKEQKSTLKKTGDVKLMVEYRKEIADLAEKRLQDIFLTKILPVIHRRFGVKQNEMVDTYARQCISVTWRMSIQDPPLYIDNEAGLDNCEFDMRLYKPYNNSGRRVLYDVWPVLRLYKDGPVLCRGVAQSDGCF